MVMTFYLQMKGTHHIHLWACPPTSQPAFVKKKRTKIKGSGKEGIHLLCTSPYPTQKTAAVKVGKAKMHKRRTRGGEKEGMEGIPPPLLTPPLSLTYDGFVHCASRDTTRVHGAGRASPKSNKKKTKGNCTWPARGTHEVPRQGNAVFAKNNERLLKEQAKEQLPTKGAQHRTLQEVVCWVGQAG